MKLPRKLKKHLKKVIVKQRNKTYGLTGKQGFTTRDIILTAATPSHIPSFPYFLRFKFRS